MSEFNLYYLGGDDADHGEELRERRDERKIVGHLDYEVIAMIFLQIRDRLPSEAETRFAAEHYQTVAKLRDLLKSSERE